MDHFDRNNSAKRKRSDGGPYMEPDDDTQGLQSGYKKKKYFDESALNESHTDFDLPSDLVSGDLDFDALGDLDEETIRKLVDSAPEAERLDASGVKKLLVQFEKAFTENTKMRVKYAGEPSKFVDSELSLDRSIKQLQAIATVPEHFIEVLKTGSHESLLNLLSHENPDIIIDVVDVLKDMLASNDDQIVDEDQKLLINQSVLVFAKELLKLQVLQLLYSAITRFDENIEEEKQGIYNALEFMENLLEVSLTDTCQVVVEKTKWVKWLLNRITSDKWGEFDDVKLYASEILCILAQSSKEIQLQIEKENGIESLVLFMSKYRKTDPKVAEEEEMVENIFDTLCVTVPQEENRNTFLQIEGLELLRILIKAKKYCKKPAIKLLNFCLTNNLQASERWMDIGGLGTLFTAFVHQTKQANKKKKNIDLEDEEHIVASIAALLTNFKDAVQTENAKMEALGDSGQESEMKQIEARLERYSSYIERITVKFAESSFEKLIRLVELHDKYYKRIQEIDQRLALEDDEEIARDEDQEQQVYEDRLEAGLFTLHLVDYILVFVSNSLQIIKEKATQLLKEKEGDWQDVKSVLLEYAVRSANETGDDEDDEDSESAYIRGLAMSLDEQQSSE